MNERIMQFRIGMFVISAGLILTMLIVWFGESPALLRNHVYVAVRFENAPGVAEGILVRKSGIRIGEVDSIRIDERPDQPDGVIVVMSLDPKYKLRAGSKPRISRSLIGDVAIDMLPGTETGPLPTSKTAADAPMIEGAPVMDPAMALEKLMSAFQKVERALGAIEEASGGVKKLSESAPDINKLIATWSETGKSIKKASDGIAGFTDGNQKLVSLTLKSLGSITTKLNETLDEPTRKALQDSLIRIRDASEKLNASLADAGPAFKDLGSPVSATPTTNLGQTMLRMNLVARDVGLLTRELNDGQNTLNTNGTVQKLLLEAELYNNINRLSVRASETLATIRPIIESLRVFSRKLEQDPGSIARGMLKR
ncbi:MAG: MCE family protein [Planctomycetota bacterium]|nr:MCE family protein [Planctomycetota bacterium]